MGVGEQRRPGGAPDNVVKNACSMYLKQAEKKISQGNNEKAAFVLELLEMRLRGHTNKLRGNPFQLAEGSLKPQAVNSHPARFGGKMN